VQGADKYIWSSRQTDTLGVRNFGALRRNVRSLHAVLAHQQLALTPTYHARALPAVVAKLYNATTFAK
jgi:hypothetical protein